jgi:hypothetical protein
VRLALLHTSPVHVATFDALAAADAPDVDLVHVVREELLARAREHGPEAVADDVAAAVAGLDADAVLCTCSTIGAVAERYGALRVDRPMAAEAARLAGGGGRVVVLAALETTLAPTFALLVEEGVPEAALDAVVVPGAWERFEAGDTEGYLALVRAAVAEAAAGGAVVVVLAQASMAAADDGRSAVPVLSSPRLGLRAAVARVSSGRTPGGTPPGSPGTAPPPPAG